MTAYIFETAMKHMDNIQECLAIEALPDITISGTYWQAWVTRWNDASKEERLEAAKIRSYCTCTRCVNYCRQKGIRRRTT